MQPSGGVSRSTSARHTAPSYLTQPYAPTPSLLTDSPIFHIYCSPLFWSFLFFHVRKISFVTHWTPLLAESAPPTFRFTVELDGDGPELDPNMFSFVRSRGNLSGEETVGDGCMPPSPHGIRCDASSRSRMRWPPTKHHPPVCAAVSSSSTCY